MCRWWWLWVLNNARRNNRVRLLNYLVRGQWPWVHEGWVICWIFEAVLAKRESLIADTCLVTRPPPLQMIDFPQSLELWLLDQAYQCVGTACYHRQAWWLFLKRTQYLCIEVKREYIVWLLFLISYFEHSHMLSHLKVFNLEWHIALHDQDRCLYIVGAPDQEVPGSFNKNTWIHPLGSNFQEADCCFVVSPGRGLFCRWSEGYLLEGLRVLIFTCWENCLEKIVGSCQEESVVRA